MAITIKGIRIEVISINRDAENGGHKIETAEYALISSLEKVLAKQPVGGYNGLKLEPSVATVKALRAFMDSYTADVTGALGLEPES